MRLWPLFGHAARSGGNLRSAIPGAGGIEVLFQTSIHGIVRDQQLQSYEWFAGSGASADNSLRSTAEAPKVTLVRDGKQLEIRHLGFAACGSSIR
jgi:hypothetical protein